MDPTFLVALGGMVLAVAVAAIFMRRSPSAAAEAAARAVVETVFADGQAQLLRYHCPHCGQVLRQEAVLAAEAPHTALSRAESGCAAGAAVCPACGEPVHIVAGVKDIQETRP